jgi:hypothetical protein
MLVFVVTVVLNVVAMALVFSRGVAFSSSAAGLAIQLPLVVALAAACGAILVKVRGMTRAEAGFALHARSPLELVAAMALASLVLSVVAAVVVVAAAPLDTSSAPPSISGNAIALVSCTVNAAFQQIALQSMALAAAGASTRSRALAFVGACAFFTLTHAVETTSPVFLANVMMFALVSSLLFHTRGYAAAIGFHAGWNFTRMALLGAPIAEGTPDTVAATTPSAGVFVWPLEPALVTGGVHGPDGGVACLAVLALSLVAALGIVRVRSAVGQGRAMDVNL